MQNKKDPQKCMEVQYNPVFNGVFVSSCICLDHESS